MDKKTYEIPAFPLETYTLKIPREFNTCIEFLSDEELAILMRIYEITYQQMQFAKGCDKESYASFSRQCDVLAKLINIHGAQHNDFNKMMDEENKKNVIGYNL